MLLVNRVLVGFGVSGFAILRRGVSSVLRPLLSVFLAKSDGDVNEKCQGTVRGR